MRHVLAVTAILVSAQMAQSEELLLQCVFDLECVETEPCGMTAYGMDILLSAEDVPWSAVADTDAETMSGEAYPLGEGVLIRLGSSIGPVMITIDGDGFARHSVHTTDALKMINYTGGCDVGE